VKHHVVAAIIIALGLVAYGIISKGPFKLMNVGDGRVLRINRWTGSITACFVANDGRVICAPEGQDFFEDVTNTVRNSN
jgi:hypothetical protein